MRKKDRIPAQPFLCEGANSQARRVLSAMEARTRSAVACGAITLLENAVSRPAISWLYSVIVGETIFRGIHFEVGFGMSSGNPSGSPPSMQTLPPQSRLTYEGVMLGVDSSGADRGEHLEGHARLEFRASAGDARMDVSFTNIRGRSTDVSYEDVAWSDLGVEDNGTFDGGTINGAFYGPAHEEVGGAFSTGEFTGAYGARR